MSGYDINPDEFLLAGGKPSAKFESPGDVVTGVIVQKEMQQQRDYDDNTPLFYKDSTPENPKPIMQLVLTLQTTEREEGNDLDDGQRNIYVRGNLRNAIANAVRSAGATGLAIGGGLSVTHTGLGTKTNPKYNAPKLYSAVYMKPTEPETKLEEIETPKAAPKKAAPKAAAEAELPKDAADMLAKMMAAKG